MLFVVMLLCGLPLLLLVPELVRRAAHTTSPAPAPVVCDTPLYRRDVDGTVEQAWLDYDLYRVAGWLPGERDYRVGGAR